MTYLNLTATVAGLPVHSDGQLIVSRYGATVATVNGDVFLANAIAQLINLGATEADRLNAQHEAREARDLKLFVAQLAAKKAKRPVDHHRKARETFKRIVAELGTSFTVTGDDYIEVAPWAGFPLGFTTFHYNWTETHERFEHALGDPSILDEAGYYSI